MEPERDRIAAAIVAAGRRLAARGLVIATEGNLSTRIGDGRILVTPSGRRKDELEVSDLAEVDLATGRPQADARPTSDLAIHLAIYRARPDARAVVHAHLPTAMALTLAGEIPDPAVLPETALFVPVLPFVPFGVPGSEELAARIAAALADAGDDVTLPRQGPANAALLERHGAVAIGERIDQAVDRLELVDLLCRVWRDARTLAPARTFESPRPSA